MKKRTDEEKRELIDKACDLFNEANKKIIEGKRLMHLCEIDFCDGFHESEASEVLGDFNLHVYRGIKKLEKFTGSESYHPMEYITQKPDGRRLNLEYKGLLFMQFSNEKPLTSRKYIFK